MKNILGNIFVNLSNKLIILGRNKKNMISVEQINEAFWKQNLVSGRMLSGSKSGYWKQYPNNLTVFNANIIEPNLGKIWYGDIDVNKDGEKLKQLASELGTEFYILREMDARFENENKPINELLKKAVWSTSQNIPHEITK